MNKSGFVIVEVLVAFIILTTTISLLTYSQKQFNSIINKLDNYENTYITVLSLKNKIDIELQLGDKEHYDGKINGINYSIDLKKVNEGQNIIYDDMDKSSTKGLHTFMLYHVVIKLHETGKEYSFYKLKTYFDQTSLGNF